VVIAERFRAIREAKNLSTEEVERRAGLERSYLRDVESGKTAPPLLVWEKIAVALEIPLAKLFYDSEGLLHLPNLPGRKTADDIAGVQNSGEGKKPHATILKE
jgi:transcriptional regulator with XRE-family HTH domain